MVNPHWRGVPAVGGAVARLCAVLAMIVTVGACSPEIAARGNQPTESRLSEIEPGEQTRAEVAALLGTPSTTATFDDETWYYISAQTQQYAVFPRKELEREVIAIAFGEDGMVKEVRNLTLADGNEVSIVQRETPTLGNEMSILEQLLGNIGRFDSDSGGSGLTQTIPGL